MRSKSSSSTDHCSVAAPFVRLCYTLPQISVDGVALAPLWVIRCVLTYVAALFIRPRFIVQSYLVLAICSSSSLPRCRISQLLLALEWAASGVGVCLYFYVLLSPRIVACVKNPRLCVCRLSPLRLDVCPERDRVAPNLYWWILVPTSSFGLWLLHWVKFLSELLLCTGGYRTSQLGHNF